MSYHGILCIWWKLHRCTNPVHIWATNSDITMPKNFLAPSRHSANHHYNDIIMGMMASQITSLMIVYSTIYSGTDQREHQSSMSLAFVRGIHRWPVNSLHKGPVTQKMFPFVDIIMHKVKHSFPKCRKICFQWSDAWIWNVQQILTTYHSAIWVKRLVYQ